MIHTNQIFTVALTTVLGLAAAFVLALPLAVGFLAGLLLLVYFLMRQGMNWLDVVKSSFRGALDTKEVILILLFVGLLIPAWSASGTIHVMIELGTNAFAIPYFLTCSFVLSAVISLILGTSTGTLSAVGIPIVGMALQLNIPIPLVAGALISGVFVGERSSPFSSAFQLVADSVQMERSKLSRTVLPTTILGASVTLLFFMATDLTQGWTGMIALPNGSDSQLSNYWLLLPPLLLVGTMLLRLGTKLAFILAIISGVCIGIWQQAIPVTDWPSILWNGWTYDGPQGYTTTAVSSMIELTILIALAGSFNELLERSHAIEGMIQRAFEKNKHLLHATWKATLFGLTMGLVSCTQTLPIMMTGRHLRTSWIPQFGTASLGRVVADTSLLFAVLVPWNMLAIICSTIIQVPVLDYMPYALYVWSIPVFTLLVSYVSGKRQYKST